MFWLVVGLVLVLGVGMFLLIPGAYRLADRAEALGMWPDRVDLPRRPWTIWPEWSFALWMDLFRPSKQRDPEYLQYQNRVRLGAVLVFVGFAGIFAIVTLTEGR